MSGPRNTGLRRAWPAFYLGLWAASLLAIGVVLMVGHWVALPRPENDDASLVRGLAGLAQEPGDSAWHMTHVLYVDCRCSQRIFEYLAGRSTPPGVRERVLLIGQHEGWEHRAGERGIEIVAVGPDELRERFGIESAPLLLIGDPQGRIRYSGGHAGRKQGLDHQDVAILDALRSGADVEPLPVYGCGVGRELQSILDPVGIKYVR